MSETQRLPSGTITFLFSDIEGSTRLWEQAPEAVLMALARHDEIVEDTVNRCNGYVHKPRGEGDSNFVVFVQPSDAVAAAVSIQQQFYAEPWRTPRPLRVRMAIHTGEANLRLGDYYGPEVNRAARLRSIAHGGQILLSDVTWQLVQDSLPASAVANDEGEHRLKDIARPEHVYQLFIRDLPQRFPPLKSLSVVPNNLPQQLTDFVGRRKEIKQFKRLLAESRLLTVVGPGGIGKTRLTLEVVGDLVSDFKEGVYFINLAPLTASEYIGQAVAEAIGLSLSTTEEPRQQLLNYLRGRQQLLIFDNFEHIIDGVDLVGDILANAPGVKIVATSRVRLNLSGETAFSVKGLQLDTELEPASTEQNEAVALFISAATRSRPEFALRDEDTEALAKIIRLVEGSPLGILMAASWVDMLPIPEIASEISQSIDFLETEAQDVPSRQRNFRAVFEYSWRLLSQSERELFVALSLFRGGFNRKAAQIVAGASLRQLSILVNKSFLSADPRAGRYSVHELLRQYGEAYLREDELRLQAILSAHARFFADYSAESWQRITHGDQSQALLDVEADIENIRTAWRHLILAGDTDNAYKMVRTLWMIHEVRGWHVAAVELFEDTVRTIQFHSSRASFGRFIALCKSVLGWFKSLLGVIDEATALAEQATDILRQLDDPLDLQFSLGQMNLSLYSSGELEPMRRNCQEIFESGDNRWYTIWAHLWMGQILLDEGDMRGCERELRMAEELLAGADDFWMMHWLLGGQAQLAWHYEDFESAQILLEDQLEFLKLVDLRRGIQYALTFLGRTAMMTGDYLAARHYYAESLTVAEEMSNPAAMANSIMDVASAFAGSGDMERALVLAACAYTHPLSTQSTVGNTIPVSSQADELRVSARSLLAPEVVDAAWQRGLEADFSTIVTEVSLMVASEDY